MSVSKFEGPRWDLSQEYKSFESEEFLDDLSFVKSKISEIKKLNNEYGEFNEDQFNDLTLDYAQKLIMHSEETSVVLWNMYVYTNCILSVDGVNGEAKKIFAELKELNSEFSKALLPLYRVVTFADAQQTEQICASEKTKGFYFQAKKAQFWKDYLLSPSEETLIKELEVDGFHSWSSLYDHLSVKLKCKMNINSKPTVMGLTTAINFLYSDNEENRKEAYLSLEDVWQSQEESCASILNSLAGFRLKTFERRSQKKKLHFLDPVTNASHMQKKSLEGLIQALEKNKNLGQKSNLILAKVLKKKALDPWDLFAPAPKVFDSAETKLTFVEAIEKIERCFSQISPLMGVFVRTAYKNKWIEGSHSPQKRAGGYCTKFAKSKEPRIFMTYDGSLGDVSTLAHELGHAYHSWVMRDLSLHEKHYPMTLAETASIFSETLLFEELLKSARSPQEKLNLLWEDISNVVSFLINIPTRYSFEKEFYEKKSEGKYFSPESLTELNNKHFKNWYGNSISEPHSYFWMSKLHFYMSATSFYNFPYSFGYLFGLKVFSKKDELKDNFHEFYVSLLRDTGRMSAEEIVKKHFQEDLSESDFWDSSMKMIEKKITRMTDFLEDHPIKI